MITTTTTTTVLSPFTPAHHESAILQSARFDSLLDVLFASDHNDFDVHCYQSHVKQPLFPNRRYPSGPLPSYDAALYESCRKSAFTRSLTIAIDSSNASMAVETAPGSPPELSSSKSSTKSSSLHSSGIDNGDDFNDTSNFEDISLGDSPLSDSRAIPSLAVKPRTLLRTATAPAATPQVLPGGHLRELPNGLRENAARNNFAQNGKEARPRLYKYNTQARSPSPSNTRGIATSPRSPGSPASPAPPSPSDPHSRRGSWQPTRRKTAKELEQEYTDSDEDIPEGAVVCNIPLSPRPQEPRSVSRSPDRTPPSVTSNLSSSPRFRGPRTRSWETAMRDMSREVRDLSSKLESHAENNIARSDSPPTDSATPNSSPPRPGPQPRSKSVALPPLQRGHNLIDPLPVSKEKEKHLSRTRPGWLPPKSRKEEQKHLREYQRMMSSFLKEEKRKSAEQEERRKSRSKEEAELTRLWAQTVIPDWTRATALPSTRQLWWRGCPSYLRGVVWTKAIGNELHLSPKSYAAALARAKGRSRPNNNIHSAVHINGSRSEKNITDIHYDIAQTFPALELYQPAQPRHTALVDLLLAYSSYRSDTGYVRGTASIAALFLLYIPTPAEAFIPLANLLNRPMSLSFCLGDTTHKERAYKHIMRTMRYKLPKLYSHLTAPSSGLDQSDYLEMMCTTLFTGLLSAEETSRIWDIVVFEGDDAIIRAVIGILSRLESRLYDDKNDVLKVIGWDAVSRGRGVDVGGEEELMDAVKWAGREEPVQQSPVVKSVENGVKLPQVVRVSTA